MSNDNHPVIDYLTQHSPDTVSPSFLALLGSLTEVAKVSPTTASSIVKELKDQRSHLKLIASENYSSLNSQLAMGNWLTDKYAEGFPGSRFYAGCDNVDSIEAEACAQACKLFGAEHAYVQPHSGADANLIAFWSMLTSRVSVPFMENIGEKNLAHLSKDDWAKLRKELGNQRLLGLDYYSGGHLTHGYRHNISAQLFDCYSYTVDPKDGFLNYDSIEAQAKEIKPLVLLAGYSAYPGKINFRRMREIADSCGALLMVDMAHFAGLVASKVYTGDFDPVAFADIVTSTTHKTLRGPRGGIVLCKKELSEIVDKGCPMVIGGPLPHVMAAKAVAFTEANKPCFQQYGQKVLENAKTLAQAFVDEGFKVLTGTTENHLLLIDVTPLGLNGKQAENAIRECGVTLNRNSLPFDKNGPWYTSGLRVGVPAMTTLGMGAEEMKEIAAIFKVILGNTQAVVLETGKNAGQPSKVKYTTTAEAQTEGRQRVEALLAKFVLYPEIDLPFLEKHFVSQN